MNNLYIKQIDNQIAKAIIVKNHYSHTTSFGIELSLGLYQTGGLYDADALLGVILYSAPVGCFVHKGISPLISSQKQIFELTRLWVHDCLGKNTESWFIAQSFEYLRSHRPEIKILISYSDTEQNHAGKIYQATNWIYQGTFNSAERMYSFDGGKSWKHNKSLRNFYKATTTQELFKRLPKPFWFKSTSPKHRYLFPLGNKRERRQLIKTLTYKQKNYPMVTEHFKPDIVKYERECELDFWN